MVSQLILWTCNSLEAILLLRAVRGRFFAKYSLFYAYLLWVLLRSLAGFYIMLRHPGLYPTFYWDTQFFDGLLGCGIIFELYRQGLVHYPGAARMTRNVLAFIFAMVISKVLANVMSGPVRSPAPIAYDLERSLRMVQSIFLIALLALFYYYVIPLGKNLRGMMLGYGFFLGTSVVNLTFRTQLGSGFHMWWAYIQPLSYVLVLAIWCPALWSYEPMPLPDPKSKLEYDYQVLSLETKKHLVQIRSYLSKAALP
ncbi:MAG: hypothetical protein LAN84_07560 [Acidobacteriia bacterium]|nr:hypothetical protein [Terriglobia bacterium]